eukprot:4347009-Alexandrium_andersonii.AAC.1
MDPRYQDQDQCESARANQPPAIPTTTAAKSTSMLGLQRWGAAASRERLVAAVATVGGLQACRWRAVRERGERRGRQWESPVGACR